MATNHFGPFLLTGLLLPSWSRAARAGGHVSSQMHRIARRDRWATPGRRSGATRMAPVRRDEAGQPVVRTHELDRRLWEVNLPLRALRPTPVSRAPTGGGRAAWSGLRRVASILTPPLSGLRAAHMGCASHPDGRHRGPAGLMIVVRLKLFHDMWTAGCGLQQRFVVMSNFSVSSGVLSEWTQPTWPPRPQARAPATARHMREAHRRLSFGNSTNPAPGRLSVCGRSASQPFWQGTAPPPV